MRNLEEEILELLRRYPGLSINELQRKLQVNKNNLIELYKDMIQRGLLKSEKIDNKIILRGRNIPQNESTLLLQALITSVMYNLIRNPEKSLTH